MTLTFDSLAQAWWPYLFILLAGTLATEVWRWIGVIAGGSLSEGSEALMLVRTVATALVAAVVGQLILFPSGELAASPVAVRLLAAALGWTAFMLARRSVLVGVLTAEAALFAGWQLFS